METFPVNERTSSRNSLKEELPNDNDYIRDLEIQLEEARAERDSAIENLEVIQEGFEQLKNGSLGEELGNAFQNFQNFAASPGGGEEDMLREENEELRVQIQSLEESLADARASLAREREFAEMVSQDDEKSAAQQAEIQQTKKRVQAMEADLRSARDECDTVHTQLAEQHDTVRRLESQVAQYKDELAQERKAREEAMDEIDFIQQRGTELEAQLVEVQRDNETSVRTARQLEEQLEHAEAGFVEEITKLREEAAEAKQELMDSERTIRRLHDDLEDHTQPPPLISQSSTASIQVSTATNALADDLVRDLESANQLRSDLSRAVDTIRCGAPNIEADLDLQGSIEALLSEYRTKEILHSQLERNLKALERRLESQTSTLQERTGLLLTTTTAMDGLRKRMQKLMEVSSMCITTKAAEVPGSSLKRNASLAATDSTASTATGATNLTVDSVEAACDALKIVYDDAESWMRKLLTDHRDALRAEVLKLVHKEDAMRNTFQVELKKAQIAAGFSCKYIGVTEVDSPRPGQDELWKCIDKIEMEAATSPAVPVIIASVPRSTYKDHPWPATVYIRGQDGRALVSKPYVHLCSVGQVETFVIFVCYTRTLSKARKFYVHVLGCRTTQDAEDLSRIMIKQCETAHMHLRSGGKRSASMKRTSVAPTPTTAPALHSPLASTPTHHPSTPMDQSQRKPTANVDTPVPKTRGGSSFRRRKAPSTPSVASLLRQSSNTPGVGEAITGMDALGANEAASKNTPTRQGSASSITSAKSASSAKSSSSVRSSLRKNSTASLQQGGNNAANEKLTASQQLSNQSLLTTVVEVNGFGSWATSGKSTEVKQVPVVATAQTSATHKPSRRGSSMRRASHQCATVAQPTALHAKQKSQPSMIGTLRSVPQQPRPQQTRPQQTRPQQTRAAAPPVPTIGGFGSWASGGTQ